ncbi:Uncharacterised protein [Mycobacteroides abscessus]|nr:Uncharacterised protein [Mycobacteroides abscessus]
MKRCAAASWVTPNASRRSSTARSFSRLRRSRKSTAAVCGMRQHAAKYVISTRWRRNSAYERGRSCPSTRCAMAWRASDRSPWPPGIDAGGR